MSLSDQEESAIAPGIAWPSRDEYKKMVLVKRAVITGSSSEVNEIWKDEGDRKGVRWGVRVACADESEWFVHSAVVDCKGLLTRIARYPSPSPTFPPAIQLCARSMAL